MSLKPPQNLYALMLGLPEDLTEPDHYQLLNLPRFTDDQDRIREAAAIQNGRLLKWQNSEHFQASMELVREVVEAKRVLGTPELKQEYDRNLKRQLNQSHRKSRAALLVGWSLVLLVGGGLIWYVVFHREEARVTRVPDVPAESDPSNTRSPETDRHVSKAASLATDTGKKHPKTSLPQNATQPPTPGASTRGDAAEASEMARGETSPSVLPVVSNSPAVAAIDVELNRRRAKALAEADQVWDALAIYNRIAAVTGQPVDPGTVRNLYFRTQQYEKVLAGLAELPRPLNNHLQGVEALCLYELGRHREFRERRAKRLSEYKAVQGNWGDVTLAWMCMVLPVEPEFQDAARLLASSHENPPEGQGWRRPYVGRLKYRLHELLDWQAKLPDDSPLRYNHRLLLPMAKFRQRPSEENRQVLEEIVAREEANRQRAISDGVLPWNFHDFIMKTARIREAKKMLGDESTLKFFMADDVRQELTQLEREAEQTGQPIDAKAARNLYARTLQWDKACEAYRTSSPGHPFMLLLFYETGRYDEFREARKERLSNYMSVRNDWIDWEYARIATLLPVEPELYKQLEILASANSSPDVTESWRNYLVGRLKYRLGTFPTWHAALPENSPLRRHNQLLDAIVEYQEDGSEENRVSLKEQLQTAMHRLRGRTQDGVLGWHWHEYILDLSMIREAGKTLGGFDAIRFLTPDELQHELTRHERGSKFPKDEIALLHLYVCNQKWEKAAEVSAKAVGALKPLTLMLWHRAGRWDKYLAGRKAVLDEYEKLESEDYFPFAQMAVLHPIDTDLQPALEYLAQVNRDATGPASWKNRRMVGFLMYRLDKFSDWYAGLPEDSNLRTIETRLLAPMAKFQNEPTDESRIALEEELDQREESIRNFYYRDGLLKPHPSLEHYCWNLFDTALVREARRTLNPPSRSKSSVQ